MAAGSRTGTVKRRRTGSKKDDDMQRILITGASGFVGENLAHRFTSLGARVFLVYGSHVPQTRSDGAFRVDLSVRDDLPRVLGDLHVDAVVHTAAIVSPDSCESDPEQAHAVNVEGTRETARWAEDRGARMLYFSTDLVYDGDRSPYKEEDPPNPINVYGRTKLSGEEEVQRICSSWIVLRLALSYGPTRGALGDWTWKMREALREGKDLTLFTDQFRTPAYAGDTAEAVSMLIKGKENGIYHMGGSERISRYEFGRRFARAFQLPGNRFKAVRMSDVQAGAPRGRDCALNTDKLCRDTGLRLCNVEEGLLRQRQEEEKISTG